MTVLPLVVGVAVLVAACSAGRPAGAPAASTCAAAPPDAMADVRAVLERRCFACHAGDGPAAEEHDFTRIETLHAQRSAVADEVSARAMPPSSRPPLSQAEVDLLVRWARCGAGDDPQR